MGLDEIKKTMLSRNKRVREIDDGERRDIFRNEVFVKTRKDGGFHAQWKGLPWMGSGILFTFHHNGKCVSTDSCKWIDMMVEK